MTRSSRDPVPAPEVMWAAVQSCEKMRPAAIVSIVVYCLLIVTVGVRDHYAPDHFIHLWRP